MPQAPAARAGEPVEPGAAPRSVGGGEPVAPRAGLLPRAPGGVLPALLAFFLVLMATTVLRPVRDEMGVIGGVRHLPRLFLATLLLTLLLSSVVAALLRHVPRPRLAALCLRGCALSLAVFAAVLLWLERTPGALQVHAARALFVWSSACNLLVVSLFWGAMADRFSAHQGPRLFGPIASAGTLGALCGAALATALAPRTGPLPLLLLVALLLELAGLPLRRLGPAAADVASAHDPAPAPASALDPAPAPDPEAAGWLVGLRAVARSRYLQVLCLYVLLFTVTSTFAYVLQARVTAAQLTTSAARTAFFARIELWASLLTLPVQALLSAPLLRRVGIGPALGLLPVFTLAGLWGLKSAPPLSLLLAFQVTRRALDHAITKPAREVLFTVVTPSEKYAAKSIIDTFVYRGGDALGAAVAEGLLTPQRSTLGTLLLLPLCALWVGCGAWLGRAQARRAQAILAAVPHPAAPGR